MQIWETPAHQEAPEQRGPLEEPPVRQKWQDPCTITLLSDRLELSVSWRLTTNQTPSSQWESFLKGPSVICISMSATGTVSEGAMGGNHSFENRARNLTVHIEKCAQWEILLGILFGGFVPLYCNSLYPQIVSEFLGTMALWGTKNRHSWGHVAFPTLSLHLSIHLEPTPGLQS